jgi:hypothetical protein
MKCLEHLSLWVVTLQVKATGMHTHRNIVRSWTAELWQGLTYIFSFVATSHPLSIQSDFLSATVQCI